MSSKFVNSTSGVWKESNSIGGIWKWDTHGFIPNESSIILPLIELVAYDTLGYHADSAFSLELLELDSQLSSNVVHAELELLPLGVSSVLSGISSMTSVLSLPLLYLESYGSQINNWAVLELEPFELIGYFGMESSFTLPLLGLVSYGTLTNTSSLQLELLELSGELRVSNNHGRLTLLNLQLESFSGGSANLVLPKLGMESFSSNPVICKSELTLLPIELTSISGANSFLTLSLISLESSLSNSWSADGALTLEPLVLSSSLSNGHHVTSDLTLLHLQMSSGLNYQPPNAIECQFSLPLMKLDSRLKVNETLSAAFSLIPMTLVSTLSTPNIANSGFTLGLLEVEGNLYQGVYGFGFCPSSTTLTFDGDL